MSEVAGSCSIEGLDGLKKQHEKMLLFVSKDGCSGCEDMKGLLKEVVGEKLPVIEAGVEDESCLNVAKSLNIDTTPTVVYYEKGEEKMRIQPDGNKTSDDLRRELREIVVQP